MGTRPAGIGAKVPFLRTQAADLVGMTSTMASLVDARIGTRVADVVRPDDLPLRAREASGRRAVQRFEQAFTHGPVAMLLVHDGWIEGANDAAGDLYGTGAADLRGRHILDLVHPDEVQAAGAVMATIASGGRPEPQNRRVVTADGRERHVRVRFSTLDTDAAGGKHVLLHVIDRTAQVLADRERDAALSLFATAFDAAPIGMCLTTPGGRFLRVNSALCRLLRRPEADLLTCDVRSLTHADDLPADASLLAETLSGRRDGYTTEKRYLSRDGQVVHAALSVSLVRGHDGAPAHFISQIVDLTAHKAVEAQLRDLAERDALTGLLNRRRLEAELGRESARIRRHGRAACVLMIDLDGFKDVNDRYGHPAGDRVLRAVADVLVHTLRATDVAARIGGDEFAVVLPETDLTQAWHVATRLAEAVRRCARVGDVQVTASIGVAAVSGAADVDHARSIDQALAEADSAMYRAKTAGKNGVEVFQAASRS